MYLAVGHKRRLSAMLLLVSEQTFSLGEVGNDMGVVVRERLKVGSLQRELCGIRDAVSRGIDGDLLGKETHEVEMHERTQGQGLTFIYRCRIFSGIGHEWCVDDTVDV